MITDISTYKLQKAKACGIEFAVNTAEHDLTQAISQNFGPTKADLILECVGVDGVESEPEFSCAIDQRHSVVGLVPRDME